MMRRFMTISLLLALALNLRGQQPSVGQFSVGNADAVTSIGYLPAAFLIENREDHYWRLSGASYVVVNHPFLGEVYNDFANLYFIKYDRTGTPVLANYLRGTSYATHADSYMGGLTILSSASENVEAGQQVLTLDGASDLDFIASYDRNGTLEKIVKVFNMPQGQWVYPYGAMDGNDGSFYAYGIYNTALDVVGYGIIGEEWYNDYLYIIKYSSSLEVQWVFTAGFTPGMTEYGYINALRLFPLNDGEVFVSGNFDALGAGPTIGDETLPSVEGGLGLFGFKLDKNGDKVWTQNGEAGGYGYSTYIHSAWPMQNGDIAGAGISSTGYFQLNDLKVSFSTGDSYLMNHFVFRIGPDGTFRWALPLETMSYAGESKGTHSPVESRNTASEDFSQSPDFDAFHWNGKILYLAGKFTNDSLVIADRILPNKLNDGLFVTSIDLETGDPNWGYSLSSGSIYLHGFDGDRYGNPSILGSFYQNLEPEGLPPLEMTGTNMMFLLGLDYNGNPLWFNESYPQGQTYGVYGEDLEVLPGGEVFATVNSGANTMIIADTSLFRDYTATSWMISMVPNGEVSGLVSDNVGTAVFPGLVKAFRSSVSGRYPVADSMILGEDGMYHFKGLYPGMYTFQALADEQTYPDAIPTYLGDLVSWEEVVLLKLDPQEILVSQDITLVELTPLTPEDGIGGILGNVSYEDEGGLKGTMGRPVTRASVILVKKAQAKSTQSGEVVAYIETDEAGNYVFENVPDGDYTLVVDIPGLPMIQTYEVTILGNKLFGLDFTVTETWITTSGVVPVINLDAEQFLLFPNPGDGHIFVKLLDPGHYTAGIFSPDGRMVRSIELNSAAGMVELDISDLNRGLYLIRVDGDTSSSVIKYVLE